MEKREPINKKLRLGYIGVPPMTGDIYEFSEKLNTHLCITKFKGNLRSLEELRL